MKKIFSQVSLFSLLMLLFTFGTSPLLAQIDEKADEYKKTAKRKTERKVDRTVESAIDDGLDAIFKKKKKKKSDEDEWDDDGDWEIETTETKTTVEYSDEDITSNDFIGSFVLQADTRVNGQTVPDESGTTRYTFLRDKTGVQPLNSPGSPALIYDLQNRTLTTVKSQNGNKNAVVIKRPDAKIEKSGKRDVTVTPLTVTRNIQGYDCKKYLIDKPDEIVTMWVADEFYYNFRILMLSGQAQNRNGGEFSGDHFKTIYGFPVKMTVESKTEDRVTEILLRDIKSGNPDDSLFDLSGAQITDMTEY